MKDRVVRAVFAAVVIAVGCGSAWAATLTWTGEAGDGKWSTPGNWSPVQAPAKGDSVVFSGDLGAKGASTVDSDFTAESVYSLEIKADFVGSVTLGRNFWVARTFDMSAGTFTCGDFDFTVGVLDGANNNNCQINFYHRGGTFNCPSGTFEFRRSYPNSYFHTTGGTWNANGGTLKFNIRSSGTSHAFYAYDRTFCNLDFSAESAASCIIYVKGTNVVTGTLKFQCGGLSPAVADAAVFHAKGDLYLGGQSSGGATEIRVDGTDDQHIYGDDKGGTGRNSGARCCTLILDKPSGKVIASGKTISLGTTNNGCAGLQIMQGEVDLSSVEEMGLYLYSGVPLRVWPEAKVSWPKSLTLLSDTSAVLLCAHGQTFNDLTFLRGGQSQYPNNVTNTVNGQLTFSGTSIEAQAVDTPCIPQSKGSTVQGAIIVKGDVYWKRGASNAQPGGGVPLIFVGDRHQYLRTETDETCVTKLIIRKDPDSVLTAVGEEGGVVRLGCWRAASNGTGTMFDLQSGTFEFPETAFDIASVNGATIKQSGGRLVPGKAVLRVTYAANSTFGPFRDPLWDLTVRQSDSVWLNGAGSDPIVVSNNFAFLGGQWRGGPTVSVGGDWTIGNALGDPTYVTMTVNLFGDRDQKISCTNLTRNTIGKVTVEKTGGTVSLDTDFYHRNNNNCTFELKSGTIKPNGHRFLLRNMTVSAGAGVAFRPPLDKIEPMIETTGTLTLPTSGAVQLDVLGKIEPECVTHVPLFGYGSVSNYSKDRWNVRSWAPCARAPRKSVPLVENVTGEKRLYFNWRYAYGMCISIW